MLYRVLSLFLCLILLLTLAAPALAEEPSLIQQNMGKLQIYACDLSEYTAWMKSHGDCSLIVFPTGETMLVDASLSCAADAVAAWLRELGVGDRIDYFICSHHHQDHLGGFPALSEQFTFGRVLGANWSPELGIAAQDKNRTYAQALERLNMTEERLRAGDTLDIGVVRMEVLWPLPDSDLTVDEQLAAMADTDVDTGFGAMGNNHSLVFRLTYGEFSALYTGDIQKATEMELMSLYGSEGLESDFLKLQHHGNAWHGCEPEFLDTVLPWVTLCMTHTVDDFSMKKIRNYVGADFFPIYQHDYFGLVTDGEMMTYGSSATDPVTIETYE
ncbi:MAG: MBL fold metallo-hydrolase [Clostridia bacterium]|nr:MBL fold metallo-hydrolase [Clostridia bacterium]